MKNLVLTTLIAASVAGAATIAFAHARKPVQVVTQPAAAPQGETLQQMTRRLGWVGRW